MISFAEIAYEEQHGQVSWSGISMNDSEDFRRFMAHGVASRLYDEEGKAEFETHLRGLANTDFAIESLDAILASQSGEKYDWAVGEALAEEFLSCEFGIIWPWSTERDKRNPQASLQGADIVGFSVENNETRLVLGEVKTSSDEKQPPGVMSGRGGMINQIEKLATDLSVIIQLLIWLLPRCKGTEYETLFDSAIKLFLNSGNKAVSLYGILIRDTSPGERDLRNKGRSLAETIHPPTTCKLFAIYIPCAIACLPALAAGGES